MLISIGTAVASFGELHLNLVGLALMILSVYLEATRLALTQRLMQRMELHVLEAVYYISPATSLCIFGLAAAFELPHFRARRFFRHDLLGTWHLFLGNAALAFLVNFGGLLVIQRAPAAATARAAPPGASRHTRP